MIATAEAVLDDAEIKLQLIVYHDELSRVD